MPATPATEALTSMSMPASDASLARTPMPTQSEAPWPAPAPRPTPAPRPRPGPTVIAPQKPELPSAAKPGPSAGCRLCQPWPSSQHGSPLAQDCSSPEGPPSRPIASGSPLPAAAIPWESAFQAKCYPFRVAVKLMSIRRKHESSTIHSGIYRQIGREVRYSQPGRGAEQKVPGEGLGDCPLASTPPRGGQGVRASGPGGDGGTGEG